MNSLTKLHFDFLAALDHALVLQTPKTAWTTECYGTPLQQRQAWAKYHDLKAALTERLYAIEHVERCIGSSPALAAPYEGGAEQHNDPYQVMAFAIFRDAHTGD